MFGFRVTLFVAALLFSNAAPAVADCAIRGIEPVADKSIGYRDRQGVCEGLFRQPVAASAKLAVIGFHRHAPNYQPRGIAPIAVSTNIAGAARLRVVSSRQRQYYRMDTSLDGGGKFAWRRDVIDHPGVHLMPHEVKAIACQGSCDVAEPRLLPVSISDAPATATKGVTLWLRAALDLKQLFVTVERLSDRKAELSEDLLFKQQPLPAGAAKELFMTLKPGQYRLRATAVPTGNNAIDEFRALLVVQ